MLKYLKSYKLFESNKIDILTDIEDICLELTDYEMLYDIKPNQVYYTTNDHSPSFKNECISIKIKDIHSRFFRIEDIEDVILRINNYLENTDWSIDCAFPSDDVYMSLEDFWDEYSGEDFYDLWVFIYRPFKESISEEVYYPSLKDCEGYVDANDLVGQRLWFHTNRTHKNHGWNGLIGVYDATRGGRRQGYAGRYTNEVRLKSPIYFQTSEAGARSIKTTGDRILIAGVSGVVVPTNNDKSNMSLAKYDPFDKGYFHLVEDESKSKIVSASEVYFNASEQGQWEIWVKDPVFE